MASLVLPNAQRGGFNSTSRVWADAVLGLVDLSLFDQYWLELDTSGLGGLVGGPLPQTFTVSVSADFTGDGTITLYSLDRQVVSPFSTASPPYPPTTIHSVSAHLSASTQTTVEVPLNDSTGQATLARRWLTTTNTLLPLGLSWGGATGTISVGSATVTYQAAFTGLEQRSRAYGRADECPKCGRKSTRDTWLRDGYTKLLVCQYCYDEEDLVSRYHHGLGSERPGQGEG